MKTTGLRLKNTSRCKGNNCRMKGSHQKVVCKEHMRVKRPKFLQKKQEADLTDGKAKCLKWYYSKLKKNGQGRDQNEEVKVYNRFILLWCLLL
jgi:hypothetical protein